MTPIAVSSGSISSEHLRVLELVTDLLKTLSDSLNCHSVCEEIESFLIGKFIRKKGRFNNQEHSWLVFKDDQRVILDPYPLASAVPILVTTKGLSIWSALYIEGDTSISTREKLNSLKLKTIIQDIKSNKKYIVCRDGKSDIVLLDEIGLIKAADIIFGNGRAAIPWIESFKILNGDFVAPART